MRSFLLVLSIVLIGGLYAQETDFGIWFGGGFKYKINKDFDFSFGQQLRLKNNSTQFDDWYNEAELSYSPIKYYKLSGGYRLSLKANNEIKNRVYIQNTAKYKWKDNEISYRLGFQAEFEANKPNDFALRHKFGYEYKINKRWKPSASVELFYGINYKEKEWYRYRFCAGVDYTPKKHHTLNPELLFQQQFNAENPLSEFVVKLGYQYEF